MFGSLFGTVRNYGLLQKGYICQQRCGLAKIRVKVKRVRDRKLNSVVAGQRELNKAWILFSIIGSSSECCLPLKCLNLHRPKLDHLPGDPKLSTYMTSYPGIFVESSFLDSKGHPRPAFGLTPKAVKLYRKQVDILEKNQLELRDRLCRLIMLTRTRDKILPLQTIDQLQWDLGLPYDYLHSFVPNHPDRFSLVRLPDGRDGLKLLFWDHKLAVSELMKNASLQQDQEDIKNGSLAFPVSLTSGFMKRKCMDWLEEWQKLPYTSPYTNASNLDSHTNEKRVVGVLHELLHLTLHKQTELKNVRNLCNPLALPFTKAFERHPGIFYLSNYYDDTETVVLREAYNGRELKQKHPLVRIRKKLAHLLKERLDSDDEDVDPFYDSDGFPLPELLK